LGLLMLLAGTCSAQWRHFGDNKPGEGQTAGPPAMAREMIAAHNAVRKRVGTPPLTWSDRLAAVAQDWADRLLASGQFAHSHNPKYGENLYEIEGAAATPAVVVNAFASESRDYDYRLNSCRSVCGHYTQMVWNETRAVGCAVAKGGRREVWVCEYDPPGNWVGKKPY
jgi:pathogenesis-related protein 1